MICYQDRTFCSAKDCEHAACTRRITPEVVQGAKDMGLPLSKSPLWRRCDDYTGTGGVADAMCELRHLTKTCDVCPSQWTAIMVHPRDGYAAHDVYVRYRWGALRIEIDNEVWLRAILGGPLDGYLTDDAMKFHLARALAAWEKKEAPILPTPAEEEAHLKAQLDKMEQIDGTPTADLFTLLTRDGEADGRR